MNAAAEPSRSGEARRDEEQATRHRNTKGLT
jgi:hypothetical protein